MSTFFQLYKKAGGKEILRQYAQSHILLETLVLVPQIGFDKKALEIVRLYTDYKLNKRLRKKYRHFIANWKKRDVKQKNAQGDQMLNHVWYCWLQGLEQAPPIVKRCYKSIAENIQEKPIVIITNKNYREYVQFPAFIEDKYQKGVISNTHFSDLLRLELLTRYGGTWIDSTVFCSGKPYDFMLDSDLFLFQTLKPGLDGHTTAISSWFITAKANNNILQLALDLLYEYWREHDGLNSYFLFHQMFSIAASVFPDEWNKVVPFSNSTPHILLLHLFEKYDRDIYYSITNQCPLHKLSYKNQNVDQDNMEDTYYNRIMAGDDYNG